MRLVEQVAIITGGGGDIGRATALCLAREGARIAIADINEAAAQDTVAKIEGSGGHALAVKTDVTDREQVENMTQRTMEAFGRIDILINNAGNALLTPLLETRAEDWDLTIKTHLYGAFFCTQAAVRHMVSRRYGRVVNISSVSGLVGSAGRTAYGTAKGALVALTKILAVELAPQGIRVNAIAPGPVDTKAARKAHTPADREEYHRLIPVARYAQPEEIAHAVLFFCLTESDYITGQVLAIDGGFTITGIQWR